MSSRRDIVDLSTISLPTHQLFKPLVIVGPSGAGKGTLLSEITSKYDKFSFSVSHTTRKPREGEVNGFQYNFVSMERFQEMIKNDEFIEYCEVHSNMYGTTKSQISSI